MSWWRTAIDKADAYYDRDWRSVWFQPILALFIFGAMLRLAFTSTDPPPFHVVLQMDFYRTWLCIGMVSPVLMLISWVLIRRGGRSKVMGFGVRLAGDIGLLTVLLSYHVVSANTGECSPSPGCSRVTCSGRR